MCAIAIAFLPLASLCLPHHCLGTTVEHVSTSMHERSAPVSVLNALHRHMFGSQLCRTTLTSGRLSA